MTKLIAAALLCAAAQAQAPSQREQLKLRMKEHPSDPWPPMKGHVVLAVPGSRMDQKGYHEPGAWFSPAPGSFGITVLPQMESTQRLDGFAVATRTAAWTARWSVAGDCAYSLTVEALQPGTRVRVQSAGPAGGPLRALAVKNGALAANDEWALAPVVDVKTGGDGDWLWAEIAVSGTQTFTLKRLTPCVATSLKPSTGVEADVPDAAFNLSLKAQAAHLLMGLAGEETRPGETVNYPLAWLRDGTYTLTALASAGQLDVARRLARKFAEEDFFGGFGPEADAPGLALWALEETAARLRDPQFDRWLWPHAHRKAEFILRMLTTAEPIRVVVSGPIVPSLWKDPELDLVCSASRDGLIIGRMDHHRPLLYVNGVSYSGLISASALAERMGAKDDATRWRAAAAELRKAWWRAFDTKERGNERTAIVGLWPSGVAADQPERYRAALEHGWDPAFSKRPLWTYFDFARAHNWLREGDPAAAWQTLNYFWSHQPSPGLYTAWEGEGEENSFGLWKQIRGWVDPPHVTPHYWAASEMLHLQLDMLAYVDESGLMIGAGVPREWLDKTISVRGVHTALGVVDWQWSAGKLRVTVDGKPARFRKAPVFTAYEK